MRGVWTCANHRVGAQIDNREVKICYVAVPVPVMDKSCYKIEMFGTRHEKVL